MGGEFIWFVNHSAYNIVQRVRVRERERYITYLILYQRVSQSIFGAQ